MRPPGLPGNPEDVLREVLFWVLGIGQFLREQHRPLCLESIRNVFEEDEPQGDVLVVGGLHVAAELIGRRPELRLEAEIGAIVIRLFRHLVLTVLLLRGSRITFNG